MTPKLIIFDLDGTLINAYRAVHRSINFALTEMGFEPKSLSLIKRSVGWGDRQLIEEFVGPSLVEPTLAVYRAHHADALRQDGVCFLPGAKALLDTLRKEGYRLAVATNRPARFSHIILEELGIASYFDCVLCADQLGQGKPHPDILFEILKRLALSENEALFVGDMVIDVQTGRAANVRTVAVTTGSSTVEELRAFGPYRIISKIGQLKIIINELKRGKESHNGQETAQRKTKLAFKKS